MGLNFSHGEASWAYSGFGVFRRALARHEGFELNEMEGFWDNTTGITGTRPWDTVCTPLKPLLDHSRLRRRIDAAGVRTGSSQAA